MCEIFKSAFGTWNLKKEFPITEKIGVEELKLLQRYANVFKKGAKFHYYIFSKGGFTEGLKEKAAQGEVMLLTLSDIYK